MSVLSAPAAGFPLWVVRRGPWFLAVLVTASAVVPAVAAIGDLDHSFPAPPPRSNNPLLALCAGGAIWALQLRHSLAAARGERPAAWPVSLAALAVLALVPWWWFSVNWITALWFPLASAVMCLRGRAAASLMTVALVVQGVVAGWATVVTGGGVRAVLTVTAYNTVFLGFGVGALYWSALLVHRIDELFATRADLARTAVTGERRRMSRDLHDLLGQSLSAISLKADLVLRLLAARPDTAGREIDGITEVAHQARQQVRAIARAAHDISLEAETEGAVALLEAGGIEVHTRLRLPPLSGPVDALFAWAVREATTNILRHSRAQRCWLTATERHGVLQLQIVNDGAPPGEPTGGTGLAGLADRARSVGGQVRPRHERGRFQLTVEVPTSPKEVG